MSWSDLCSGGAGEVEGAGGGRAQSTTERQREPAGETPAAPGAPATRGFPYASCRAGSLKEEKHTVTMEIITRRVEQQSQDMWSVCPTFQQQN